MPKGDSYFDVVNRAVDDVVKHGFDSMDRIKFWEERITAAAQKAMGSTAHMEKLLRDGLVSMYRKLVENGDIAKYHPGVSRFTIDKLRPKLHSELERRILASANLIKLNRTRMVTQTLQRFSGWATSVPAGGSKTQKKRDEAAKLKKPLKSLPYEQRRVLIDQGHKFTGALNEIIAVDGGAIAGRWHSHWRTPGYDYREDHKDRDQKVYAVRGNWALKAGLMKAGPAGFYDKITAVGEEPFCRCYMTWLYNLRDLPPDMVTAKGATELANVRKKLAS